MVDPDGREKHICFYLPELKNHVSTQQEMIQYKNDLAVRRKNASLDTYAKNFSDNENIIIFFGHGIQNKERTKGIGVQINNKSTRVKGLENYLKNTSQWLKDNQKADLKPVILLFSCGTGKGEESIAEQLSYNMGAIVIAPSETIIIKGNEIPKVYEEGYFINDPGVWKVFYDGKVVDELRGYGKDAIDISSFIKNLNVERFVKEMGEISSKDK